MAMISSTDRKRAKTLFEQCERLSERLDALALPSMPQLAKHMKEAAEAIVEVDVMRLLSDVDVSFLELCDVHLTNSIKASYPTIASLLEASQTDLASLFQQEHLLGRPHADKTLEGAYAIQREVRKVVPCNIDGGVRTSERMLLLRDAIAYERAQPLVQARDKLVASIASCVHDMADIQPATSLMGSLFMGRERRDAIVVTIGRLERALQDTTERIDEIERDATGLVPIGDDEAWALYRSRPAHYDSLIERLTGECVNKEMPVVTSGLAMDIVALTRRRQAVERAHRMITDENLIGDPIKERAGLERLIREERERAAQLRLSEIDIDVLASGGARVGPFKTAGFAKLGDVRGKTLRSLTRHRGITEQSARGVLKAIDDIYQSAFESARCRLDAEGRPASQEPLVKALYISKAEQPLRAEYKELDASISLLRQRTSGAGSASNPIELLVLTQARKEITASQCDVLKESLPPLESRVGALLAKAKLVQVVTSDEAWNEFSRDAASYYARIEELGGGFAEASIGDLPKTLADEVSTYMLDTSLMRATLRSYQSFGAKYVLHQGRALIGDEMGLGKTVEAIATMAHLARRGETHFVVICPLSVLVNWEREVSAHSSLRPFAIYGRERSKEFRLWCLHGGVAITTYETVSRLDWAELGERRLGIVVVDEAHYIKNPGAKRTQAVTTQVLPLSNRALFLTGTPLENKVEEMSQLLSYLNPALVYNELGTDELVNPIEYRRKIAPVYLRRRRSDVLDELPRKIEKSDWCTLSADDRKDYVETLGEEGNNFAALRRVGWRHDHPERSAKGQRLRELCDEAKASGSKVLVFSFFLDTLSKVVRLCEDDCAGLITGQVPALRRQQMIDEFSHSDKTVLVSQITAGGVGLNIQAANIVIFCEPQLKPSIEDQAISRTYRMGQVRTVVVHRLLMSKTIDERMEKILARKRAEFDAYADTSQAGEDSLGVIDSAAIIEMIQAERKYYHVSAAT